MTMAVMSDNGNNNGNDSVVLRIHNDSSSSSEDEREDNPIVKQQQQQKKKKNNVPNGRSSLKEQQKSKKKKDPTSIAEDEASEPSGSSLERNGSYFFGGDHLLQASTQRNTAAGGAASGATGAAGGGDVDPPTKLIGSFLQRQKESGTFALDPTMDDVTFWGGSNRTTPDVSSQASPTISASQSWKNLPKPSSQDETGLRSRRASFQDQQQNEDQQDSAAILKAPSRISSGKNYARASSKSRLVEPPARPPLSSEQAKKSALLIRASQQQQQSSPQRSGMLRNKAEIQDEDDPLDVPHRFSRSKWDFWAALQLVALVIIVAGLICATNIPFLEHRKALGLDLWRWAVLALVVMSGRLLSGWIIHVLVFFIERNFLLRKRVLYFVYGLHKGVQNCLWFGIILLAWRLIFDPNLPQPIRRERKVLEIVTKVLVCLLVAASLWLLKILLVKVLALSFHVNTYFDRIQESLFSQYILETLSGPPLLEQQALIEDEKKVVQEMAGMLKSNKVPTEGLGFTAEDRPNKAVQQSGILRKSGMISTTTGKSGMLTGGTAATTKSQMLKKFGNNNEQQQQDENAISIEDLQRLNQKNVSAWNMKRLIRLVKHSRITTLAQSIEAGDLGDEDQEIQSEWQAKVGAKHIFNNVARPKSKYLTLSDFMRFLREEEAVKAFGLFDGALDSGMISKQSLINWVVNVYRERRALMFTLNDTKTAVNKLHKIIDVVMSVIIFVIWLLILEIASTHLLVLISSQLVLVAFVFGNSCKTVFEAIIFLFAMHPFDVGDRCVVDGVQMVVEEMNILTTVFLRYDNEKIYYPNTVLATKPISNFYRSPDMGDAIDFSIHIATPREKIEALKEKIAAYIDSHLHHWYVTHTVVMKEIEDMNRIRMAIWLQHTMNHQDAGEKWIRRSDLLFYLKDVFQELGIDYRMLPQEVHVRKI